MKVPVNSIKSGNVIEHNGRLWVASKVQHINPGKGGAFVAIEAKALREGNKLQERFRSGETIERVHIDERDCTYLFKDDNGYTFMDKENYEQLVVGADVLDPERQIAFPESVVSMLRRRSWLRPSRRNCRRMLATLASVVMRGCVSAEPSACGCGVSASPPAGSTRRLSFSMPRRTPSNA